MEEGRGQVGGYSNNPGERGSSQAVALELITSGCFETALKINPMGFLRDWMWGLREGEAKITPRSSA